MASRAGASFKRVWLIFSVWRRSGLCEAFDRGLSSMRISAGRTVTQPMTPRMTPLAITMPRSRPIVKDMKQSATKPATVVMDEPTTEEKVFLMAWVMASSLVFACSCSSLYECQRKIE